MIERGLVYQGKVIPGTEWILRDSTAWYSKGDDDVYARSFPIRLLTEHWTAGPRRNGELAAQKTYRAMQARRKDNGEEMSVSAQFVRSNDGLLFQLADLELCCVHADREFNRGGTSVENAYPGTQAQSEKLGAPEQGEARIVAGTKVMALRPTQAMLDSSARFVELLASLRGDRRFLINGAPLFDLPRVAYTRRTRLSGAEMRSAKGVVEHFHAVSTEKVDAAGWFVDHAAKQPGWQGDAT